MPRKKRIESRMNYYHVMCRGNNKNNVFCLKEQKVFYRAIIKKYLEKYDIKIYAWCIMDNHVHLFLNGEINDISSYIKVINSTYALKYNNDYSHIGHVFQGRFKSEAVEELDYFLNLIRYIHNNPVKAKMINDNRLYRWSSFNEYINGKGLIEEKVRNIVLHYFNNNISEFTAFHRGSDLNEFIDIKEDMINKRIEIINLLLIQYCRQNNIDTKYVSEEDKENIVRYIFKNKKVSIELVSSILKLSYYKVLKIYKEIIKDVNEEVG